MGSYYVLEVGNFDDETTPTSRMEPGPSEREPGSVAIPVAGEGGYYMLNTTDPTPSDDNAAYSCVSTGRLSNYENTVPVKPSVPVVKDVGGANSTLHPHLIIAEEGDLDKNGVASCTGIRSVGKSSTYENVCPPVERGMLPIPAAGGVGVASAGGVGVASASSRVPKNTAVKRSVYENVDLRPHPTPDAGPAHNTTQRRNVYEAVEIGGQKVNGQGRHSNCLSPENGNNDFVMC